MSDQPTTSGQRETVRMDLVIKEYEITAHDLLRENIMLKALLAEKNAEGNKGT